MKSYKFYSITKLSVSFILPVVKSCTVVFNTDGALVDHFSWLRRRTSLDCILGFCHL